MNINTFLRQHPALNYSSDMKEICKPLQLLNITYFSHARIDNKQMSAIANVPEFFELYFQKGYQNFDLHNAASINNQEFVLWDFVNRKKQSYELHKDFTSFHQGHTFSIVINSDGMKDCFHFATQLGNEKMNGKYLELLGHLEHFINYFKDKIANHKQLSSYCDLKIPLHSDGSYLTEEKELNIDLFNQLTQSKRVYSAFNTGYLTQREFECLTLLAQGKTLVETAIQLNISHRTVKAHINAIKERLGCLNQFQLGMLFSKLNK